MRFACLIPGFADILRDHAERVTTACTVVTRAGGGSPTAIEPKLGDIRIEAGRCMGASGCRRMAGARHPAPAIARQLSSQFLHERSGPGSGTSGCVPHLVNSILWIHALRDIDKPGGLVDTGTPKPQIRFGERHRHGTCGYAIRNNSSVQACTSAATQATRLSTSVPQLVSSAPMSTPAQRSRRTFSCFCRNRRSRL